MKILIDTDLKTVEVTEDDGHKTMELYSREAFESITRQWLKVGWSLKYPYTFSWLGRPIIQQPEDMLRIQEVIYNLKPDVILETGVAHGGSLIFYASLCKAIGKGRVIGVDIEIRPHNRQAIENHELSSYIELFEGSSTDKKIVEKVKAEVGESECVLVILDSNHSKGHVLSELEAYSSFVSIGSYIVATDGSMSWLYDVPRGEAEWVHDNPEAAAEDFVKDNKDFEIEQPQWIFNESDLQQNVTHWPSAYLKRIR